jgi:NTE family protein
MKMKSGTRNGSNGPGAANSGAAGVRGKAGAKASTISSTKSSTIAALVSAGGRARKAVESKPIDPPVLGRRPAGPSKRRRIAIACQGGGSQTAFTAGALRGLMEAGAHKEFEIVSLSGTSGGAICAALAWYAFAKGDQVPWQRLYDFWQENAASSPSERAFNHYVVESMRMTNAGRMPSLSLSPASPLVKMMMEASTRGLRPLFTDFRGLLEKHIDFAELKRWGALPDLPALVLGAVNVLNGRLAKFCSRIEPIRAEHILASCAVPSIFPAVELDGGAYWDGLFSDNPPISELTQARYVGEQNLPHEIWVIKINPTGAEAVPTTADQISDRRNELIGNGSLFQQLDALSVMNELYFKGAFAPAFAKRFDLDGPIRIPRCFCDDEVRPYHLPFIEMSPALASKLDYESKLDRSLEHIQELMADGEAQARVFLAERAALMPAQSRRRAAA